MTKRKTVRKNNKKKSEKKRGGDFLNSTQEGYRICCSAKYGEKDIDCEQSNGGLCIDPLKQVKYYCRGKKRENYVPNPQSCEKLINPIVQAANAASYKVDDLKNAVMDKVDDLRGNNYYSEYDEDDDDAKTVTSDESNGSRWSIFSRGRGGKKNKTAKKYRKSRKSKK
jgi:hypothetical protein